MTSQPLATERRATQRGNEDQLQHGDPDQLRVHGSSENGWPPRKRKSSEKGTGKGTEPWVS